MDAFVRRVWGRAVALTLTIALTTAAGISLAPAAQAAGTSVTASDAAATTGDPAPTITFTADYILTTAPTCAVYDSTDTAFATPLTGALAAGTYVSHCQGADPAPDVYVDGAVTVTDPPAPAPSAAPITPVTAALVVPVAPATATVAAGGTHSCTLIAGGGATCTGNNASGQLGDGTTNNSNSPVYVTGLTGATALAAGANHTCSLGSGGTVSCWGQNAFGQIGTGSTGGPVTTPTAVAGISGATAIAAGDYHTCAIVGGSVYCWGYNLFGALGTGDTVNHFSPIAVTGISTAVAITAGMYHTCALLASGEVDCWGFNPYGALGNGTIVDSSTPVAATGITNAVSVDAGNYHTCASLADGTVDCWGYNSHGELGNGTLVDSITPTPVVGISTATSVTVGADHSCAVFTDGSVNCWGYNADGELGDGTTTDSSVPVVAAGVAATGSVVAGGHHSCAVEATGINCWGYNLYGQLGNGGNASAPTHAPIVNPRLTIRANSPAKIAIGSPLPSIGYTTEPAPLAPGTITSEPTCAVYDQSDLLFATPLTGPQPVGSYVTHCQGGSAAGYDLVYADGFATVDRAPTVTTVTCPVVAYYTGSALTPCTATVTGPGLNLTVTPDYFDNTAIGAATAQYAFPGDASYLPSSGSASFLIRIPVNVTASSGSITYGANIPSITATITPSVPLGSFTVAPVCGVYATTDTTYSTALTGVQNAGTYVTHCTGGTSPTYWGVPVDGTLTINKAATTATVLCDPTTVVYTGLAQTPCTASVVGPNLNLTGLTPTYTNNVNVGTATASYTYPGDTNHLASAPASATFTITRAALTITASSATVTYGTTVPAVTYTTNWPTAPTFTTNPTCATYATAVSNAALTGVQPVGTYVTRCAGAVSGNFTISYVNGSLSVGQAGLTVTANSSTITYGAATPAISYTTNPSPVTFTTNPTCGVYASTDTTFATRLTGQLGAGIYVTHCSGAVNANYAITYVDGTLTVNRAAVTVTASSATITYGTAVPAVTFTTNPTPITWTTAPTCGVYAPADTAFATALTGVQDAGTYVTHCGGGVSANYTPTYVNGTLTINKAAATVTAASSSITYGTVVPAVNYSTTPAGVQFTTAPTCAVYATTDTTFTTPLAGVQNAGSYVTRCAGGVSTNYNLTYVNGTLTIGKAAVTVTASSATITYGTAVPAVTFTTNPTPITWTTTPTCATYATATSTTALTGNQPVGSYVTRCAGGVSANYTPSYVIGTLTVNAATLTVTASSPAAITYGATVPAVTFTTNPTPITWTTTPTCAVYATADTTFATALTGVQNAGTYVTHCANGAAANYVVTYVNGSLTINKAAVTVTAASPAAITYGTAVPAITYTLNPTTATFTTNPTCAVYAAADTTFVTPLSGVQNAGAYVTHCAGGVSTNYNPTYVNGALTINKAAVTVTASSPTAITTAVAVPAITYTLNPVTATFTTNPTCGVYATATSTVALTGTQAAGTYVTKCAGGVSTNYTPAYVNGSLVVQNIPTVVFTGTQVVNTGGTVTLSATSTPNTCTGAITYSLDRNPTTGAAGAFTLGASPVATTGWQDGAYLLTMSKAATATCAAVSITSATITFAATTNRAYGGGQYTVTGTPRVSASFQVGASTTTVTGQFKFVQTNTWQFIGTLTTYSRTGTTGTATGTGNLSYWNTTLNGGAGGWTSVGAAIPVRIVFVAGTTTGTLSTTFTYTPTTGQPVLPSTAAQTLGRVVANA